VTLVDGSPLGGFGLGESCRETFCGGLLLGGRNGDWRVGGCWCGAVGIEARVVGQVRQDVDAGELTGCVRAGTGSGPRLFGTWCQYAWDN
jgi:hypothetical protein